MKLLKALGFGVLATILSGIVIGVLGLLSYFFANLDYGPYYLLAGMSVLVFTIEYYKGLNR